MCIDHLRCLTRVELALHPARSYLYGPNGAGKTSILEAVYLLGRGRSFRTRETRRLVQRGSAGFSVYGETASGQGTERHRLGVGYGASGLEMRVDGKPGAVAALTEIFPVHVIGPSLHQLIEGGPSERRRFLDWGVFHVEPQYLEAWRRYRRLLGQRNAALKRSAPDSLLAPWTASLLEAGTRVDELRRSYVESLAARVARSGRDLLGADLSVEYRRGWRQGRTLEEALTATLGRDRALGSTEAGPHRADLSIRLDAAGVREEASRGQQKLVAAALILAQVSVFADHKGFGGTVLVDDPAAELDREAVGRLLEVLEGLPAQLVLTALSEGQLAPAAGAPVFHVEQGRAMPVL